jgi:5-methylcytosine-specific restriction endonuclease McrA
MKVHWFPSDERQIGRSDFTSHDCRRMFGSHDFFRVNGCSFGICRRCGYVAQDSLYRVRVALRNAKKIEGYCRTCHDKLVNPRTVRIAESGEKFCSRWCTDEWLQSLPILPKGTSQSAPFDWHFPAYKHIVIIRDKGRCMDCGVDTRQLFVDQEIHHILPRQLGGHDHPSNLKTLCKPCHDKTKNKRYVRAMRQSLPDAGQKLRPLTTFAIKEDHER